MEQLRKLLLLSTIVIFTVGFSVHGSGGGGGAAAAETVYQPVCHLIENVADEEQFDWFEMFDRATTASSIYCKSFGANVELDWENDDGSVEIIESMVCTTAGVTDVALSGTDLTFVDTDKAAVHITDVTAGATGVFTCPFFE